jgi:hypothetical protein
VGLRILLFQNRVPVVQRPRTPPFQGENTGSNPVGDAKDSNTARPKERSLALSNRAQHLSSTSSNLSLSPERFEGTAMRFEGDRYVHRLNQHRSFDSICTVCFRTIGVRARQSDLLSDEQKHVCDVGDLATLYAVNALGPSTGTDG